MLEGIENEDQQTIIDETFSEYEGEHPEDVQNLIKDLKTASAIFFPKASFRLI